MPVSEMGPPVPQYQLVMDRLGSMAVILTMFMVKLISVNVNAQNVTVAERPICRKTSSIVLHVNSSRPGDRLIISQVTRSVPVYTHHSGRPMVQARAHDSRAHQWRLITA